MIMTLISHCVKLPTFDFPDLGNLAVCFVKDPKVNLRGMFVVRVSSTSPRFPNLEMVCASKLRDK